MRNSLLALLLAPCFVAVLLLAQSGLQKVSSPKSSNSSLVSVDLYDSTTEAARRRQVDSLKRDIARMNAVLNQMQNNLGMVSTLQDPLKHQFQLEIEMWRIQLDHMNQDLLRLQGLDSAPSSPSQP